MPISHPFSDDFILQSLQYSSSLLQSVNANKPHIDPSPIDLSFPSLFKVISRPGDMEQVRVSE